MMQACASTVAAIIAIIIGSSSRLTKKNFGSRRQSRLADIVSRELAPIKNRFNRIQYFHRNVRDVFPI